MKLKILLLQMLFFSSGYICAAADSQQKVDEFAWLASFENALETNNKIEKNQHLMQVLKDKDMSFGFACFRGYTQTVQFLLQLPNISLSSHGKMHPLILAANGGHPEIVRLLLERKFPVDAVDEDGATALHKAINFDHKVISELLLAAKANPDIKNSKGIAPLHVAAHTGNLLTLRRLIEVGAAVDITSVGGLTPLCLAVNRNQADCVEELLKAGAKSDVSRLGFVRPIFRACQQGYIRCIELLLNADVSVNFVDFKSGSTPLMIAAKFGQDDAIKVLLARDADVNAVKHNGMSALLLAVIAGHPTIVELLLNAGADIAKCSDFGHSVLYMLAKSLAGEQSMKKLCASLEPLKDRLLEFDVADSGGDYVIHHAAARKDACVIEALLRWGTKHINKSNHYGETPLYVAASKGHLASVTFLCENGADCGIRNCLGFTPEEMARANGHSEIVKYLRKYRKKRAQISVDQVSHACSSAEAEAEKEPEQANVSVASCAPKVRGKENARSRGQRVAVESVFRINDHTRQENANIFALRQPVEEMTVVVYKKYNVTPTTKVIGNISGKQDKFHTFTEELDNRLGSGIRIDEKNRAQYQDLLDEHDIRYGSVEGANYFWKHAIVLPGKIEEAYYDARYANRDKGLQTRGYSGAFVYLFNANGICYHRCFHENKLSKQAHSFERI